MLRGRAESFRAAVLLTDVWHPLEGKSQSSPRASQVPRPSHEQLVLDLETMSFCAVDRKYRVSDNAVRKWLKWYERQEAADDEGEPDQRAA